VSYCFLSEIQLLEHLFLIDIFFIHLTNGMHVKLDIFFLAFPISKFFLLRFEVNWRMRFFFHRVLRSRLIIRKFLIKFYLFLADRIYPRRIRLLCQPYKIWSLFESGTIRAYWMKDVQTPGFVRIIISILNVLLCTWWLISLVRTNRQTSDRWIRKRWSVPWLTIKRANC